MKFRPLIAAVALAVVALFARHFHAVFRFDPRWPKLRLFRIVWNVGTVGDGVGYSRKLAVAIRPVLFRFRREWDGWRAAFLGLELHSQTSWGGRFVSIMIAAIVLAGIVAVTPFAALAASATDAVTTTQPLGSTVVNLAPFVALVWQVAEALLAALVPVVGGFLVAFLQKKTGLANLQISNDLWASLERTFQNGIGMVGVRLQSQFGGKLTIDVHNQLAAQLVNYVATHSATELEKLGITPQALAEKAIARLGKAGIVPPPPGTAAVATIPPIPAAPSVGTLAAPTPAR